MFRPSKTCLLSVVEMGSLSPSFPKRSAVQAITSGSPFRSGIALTIDICLAKESHAKSVSDFGARGQAYEAQQHRRFHANGEGKYARQAIEQLTAVI